MKLGRNQPCPCGSGKKYKHCCIGEAVPDTQNTTTHLIREKVQKSISVANPTSLEEVNAIVQKIASDQNNASVDDFCGLSPSQMYSFLHQPFDSGVATFTKNLDSSETPIMRLFLALADSLGDDGLKATAKGNLPLKLCKALAQQYIDDGRNSLMPRIGGISTELDFDDLHCLRLVSEKAGLLRKYGGKFLMTKKGMELFRSGNVGEIYFELFESYTMRFNWGYRDNYEEADIIQQSFLYFLFLLNQFGDEGRPQAFYSDKFMQAFPMVLSMFPKSTYSTPEMDVAHCYFIRVIDRFAFFFGLVELERTSEKLYEREYLVKKSALFDRFISFS